jgi:IclR family transcriptional regulator, KDG regulon repressor
VEARAVLHETSVTSTDGTVASVIKALAIVDFVGEHGATSLPDLVRETGLPKSTLFRLLFTLCEAGFLRRTARGEYATTVKLWRLGAKAIDYDTIHPDLIQVLRDLVGVTSETALFSIYEDGYAVYVEKVEGPQPIRAYLSIGGRTPSYACATGKALLAYRPAEEIDRIARSAESHTLSTISDPDSIASEMAEVRERGFAVNRGEWREKVWGVAAPVFDHKRHVAGSIGVSGPQNRIEHDLERLSAAVSDAAHTLTDRHGWRAVR